jgi:hypothetical protein
MHKLCKQVSVAKSKYIVSYNVIGDTNVIIRVPMHRIRPVRWLV